MCKSILFDRHKQAFCACAEATTYATTQAQVVHLGDFLSNCTRRNYSDDENKPVWPTWALGVRPLRGAKRRDNEI
jgi:hypothetical protein